MFSLVLRSTLIHSHNYAYPLLHGTASHMHKPTATYYTCERTHTNTQSIFVLLPLMENGFLATLYYSEMIDAVEGTKVGDTLLSL